MGESCRPVNPILHWLLILDRPHPQQWHITYTELITLSKTLYNAEKSISAKNSQRMVPRTGQSMRNNTTLMQETLSLQEYYSICSKFNILAYTKNTTHAGLTRVYDVNTQLAKAYRANRSTGFSILGTSIKWSWNALFVTDTENASLSVCLFNRQLTRSVRLGSKPRSCLTIHIKCRKTLWRQMGY